MKIKFALLLLCFCLFFTQETQAQRRQWTYVGNSVEETSFYIDKNFRRLSSTNTRFWEKRIFENSTSAILLIEVDCNQKQFRQHQAILYNRFGTTVESNYDLGEWFFAIPESMGEAVLEVVCRPITKKPNAPKISSKNTLAEIITENANLRESPDASSPVIREVALGEKLILTNAKPVGAWYKVVDAKTKAEGWLHGNTFKVTPKKKTQPKSRRGKKTIYV